MRITTRTATYLLAVATAIEAGRTDLILTDICPECNEKIDLFDTDHLVMERHPDVFAGPNTTAAWVIVGCEGYWVVNPATVGLPIDMWQDWAALPDDITPDDFGA